MKNYSILILSFFLIQVTAFAQKDSLKRTVTTSTRITTQKITVEQEQWLRQNFQRIVGMKKDSAKMEIRKSFSPLSNTSLEYMISRAAKLMQEDKQKHQALVQQMMRSLTAQKTALSKQIAEKEKELKKTKDVAKIKNLKDEITSLKNKMKDLNNEIKYLRSSK